MNTIIMSVLGIVLAVAAAVTTTFYGGTSYETTTIRAQANEYINAGHNIQASYNWWLNEHDGKAPMYTSFLMGASNNGKPYLASWPTFTESTTIPNSYEFKPIFWESEAVWVWLNGPNAREICKQINKMSGRAETQKDTVGSQGCRYEINYTGVGGFIFFYRM